MSTAISNEWTTSAMILGNQTPWGNTITQGARSTGYGMRNEWKQTESAQMGDQTHNRPLHTWKEHGKARPVINSCLSPLPNWYWRQKSYHPMPSQEHMETMENKYPETEHVDERTRHGTGNLHDNNVTIRAMVEWWHPVRELWRYLPGGTTTNRVGLHDGWMVHLSMARPPRKNLETCKIKEIEP